MKINIGLAMLVCGCLLRFRDGAALAQQNQTQDLSQRIQMLHDKLRELNVQARAKGPSVLSAKEIAPHAVNPIYNIDRFDPVTARYVRFTIQATVDGLPPCFDEFEVYGPSAQVNLARAAGATATASSCISDYPIHQINHLNDGKYGNSHTWISDELGKGWAQIELASETKVDRVVWSRHFGDEPVFRDR